MVRRWIAGPPAWLEVRMPTIWHHDVRSRLNTSREISGFHTPTALDEFLNTDFDANIAHLRQIPNDGARLPPYQREADSGIEVAINEAER